MVPERFDRRRSPIWQILVGLGIVTSEIDRSRPHFLEDLHPTFLGMRRRISSKSARVYDGNCQAPLSGLILTKSVSAILRFDPLQGGEIDVQASLFSPASFRVAPGYGDSSVLSSTTQELATRWHHALSNVVPI
ncbi:hypothetical protein BD779DRAFT_430814 [Infundibulicybe gibba]|nr:hypothetical protein BD779DRAFT_430814 [Infundibulicybe gibba]